MILEDGTSTITVTEQDNGLVSAKDSASPIAVTVFLGTVTVNIDNIKVAEFSDEFIKPLADILNRVQITKSNGVHP